jgi:two-component system, OmpR family, response regulator
MEEVRPRILIVDDEARFRTTMCKLLRVRGLEPVIAGSGPEAIDQLQQRQFDVVVLDVRMPEMGGVHVLAELKKIDPGVEVIIMTGYASVDTAKEITKLGAYDYMLKPYAIEELMEKIEAAYDRKTARKKLVGEPAKAT